MHTPGDHSCRLVYVHQSAVKCFEPEPMVTHGDPSSTISLHASRRMHALQTREEAFRMTTSRIVAVVLAIRRRQCALLARCVRDRWCFRIRQLTRPARNPHSAVLRPSDRRLQTRLSPRTWASAFSVRNTLRAPSYRYGSGCGGVRRLGGEE